MFCALVACGDGVVQEDVFEPVSGTQLKLEWHQYTDGTRVVEPDTFYDITLHARCTPRLWIDGVTRCVPIADDAVFGDAACETAFGRSPSTDEPRHFIAYDTLDGTPIPARLFVPGDAVDPIDEFFVMQEGACSGPFPSPVEPLTYFAIVDEVPAYRQVPIRDQELGEARLALRYREGDDGLIVPVALHDRELAARCTTMLHPELGTVCEPIGSVPSTLFGDPACTQRVITLDDASPVPVTATVAELSGCAIHHAVGAAVAPTLYRREGEKCIAATPDPAPRVYAVGAAVELPIVDQEIEDVADRRLQRIQLRSGSLRFFDDRLFDTATRTDCRRTVLGEVARCLPEPLATTTTLFGADCAVPVRVSELPERTCGRVAFAVAQAEAGLELHALGDRVVDPLFHLPDGFCQPYAGAPDTTLRALGPPLAPETFVEAFTFGER